MSYFPGHQGSTFSPLCAPTPSVPGINVLLSQSVLIPNFLIISELLNSVHVSLSLSLGSSALDMEN